MALAQRDTINFTLNRISNQEKVIIEKQYVLNLEKSLLKKLNCAKRNHITYKFTGGGFTAELDAVTFELFRYACDTYYVESANSFNDVSKDHSIDRHGNMTQITYKIKESQYDGFTLNLYITR